MESTGTMEDLAFGLFRSAVQLVRLERSIGGRTSALRLPKITALATLARQAELTTERLASIEGVSAPTMLATVTHLARDRLVTTAPDKERTRSRPLTVTRFGKQRLRSERARLAGLVSDLGNPNDSCYNCSYHSKVAVAAHIYQATQGMQAGVVTDIKASVNGGMKCHTSGGNNVTLGW